MRFLFALFLTTNALSQIGTGQWRLHVPNRMALDVVAGDNIVYTAFEKGLMEYDIANNEVSLWTDVNGLSDISLTCLEYFESKNALFIGYENGNLDKIVANKVTNIPAIRLAQVSGSKRINKIVEHDNLIYIATGFSIVIVDPIKDEVKDTYYPTNGDKPILDVAFRNDSIFALTDSIMYRGYINNPALADPAQWTVDARLSNPALNCFYQEIEVIDDQLFLLYGCTDYGKDSVFNVKNTGFEWVTNEIYDFQINSIDNSGGHLAVNIAGGIYTYNTNDYSHFSTETYFGLSDVSINNSFFYDGFTWMADHTYGLFRYANGGAVRYTFEGPANNSYYSLDCRNGKLAVSAGGVKNGKDMTYNNYGMYLFEDEQWSFKNVYNMSAWQGQNFWDVVCTSVNPTNTDKIAVGSYSEVPLSIMEDGETISTIYKTSTSPIETTMWSGTEAYISDLQYDSKGNLWIANSFCPSPLKVLTKDNVWQTMNLGSNAMNKKINKIVVDFNGNKWMSVSGVGLMGLKDQGTITDLSDDQTKLLNSGTSTGSLPSNEVTAIAVDFDNEIWIGTDNGFAILYNSESVFDATAGNYNAQRIKLEFEGNVEYLLGNTSISDIEVDGGNRKWFGTENAGIFLLSEDGSEIISTFTTENSPLISNNIMDMEFDHKTGELYIVTDKGLVSYRADASYEDAEYSNVKVFPNPYKPEDSGPITIQGIRYNSDIHITDVAGNLVAKTTSNGGTATWDGKTLQGERVKSGVYLIWTATNDKVDGKDKKVGKVVIIN